MGRTQQCWQHPRLSSDHSHTVSTLEQRCQNRCRLLQQRPAAGFSIPGTTSACIAAAAGADTWLQPPGTANAAAVGPAGLATICTAAACLQQRRGSCRKLAQAVLGQYLSRTTGCCGSESGRSLVRGIDASMQCVPAHSSCCIHACTSPRYWGATHRHRTGCWIHGASAASLTCCATMRHAGPAGEQVAHTSGAGTSSASSSPAWHIACGCSLRACSWADRSGSSSCNGPHDHGALVRVGKQHCITE